MQSWEERPPVATSGFSSPSAIRGGKVSVAVPVAVVGALEDGSTDCRDSFRINQLLVKRLGRQPDSVGDIDQSQLSKKFEQGRPRKSHGSLCLS